MLGKRRSFRQVEETGNVVEPLFLEFPLRILDLHAGTGRLAMRGTQGNNLHPAIFRNLLCHKEIRVGFRPVVGAILWDDQVCAARRSVRAGSA